MTRPHAPHFFVEGWGNSDQVAIAGPDAHHLARVRRARAGDLIQLSDGAGRIAEARLTRVTGGEVVAELLTERTVDANRPRIILFQGLAKGSKVDLAIQKLVELGVDEIVVFTSSRSVPDWDETRRREAFERWRAIALEAAKQSRRGWLPRLRGPLDIAGAADKLGGCEAAFVADPAARTSLREALSGLGAGDAGSVGAAVGPEGGLSEDEVATLSSTNALPVALGDQILRSETASLALATILMFHFRLLG